MSTAKKCLIAAAILLAAAILVTAVGFFWFQYTHVKVDGVIYDKDLQLLDLRGQEITPDQYDRLSQALPGAVIRWEVPFQGARLADDTEYLSLSSLTEAEILTLDRLTQLKKINAEDCEDYAVLEKLKAHRPGLEVDYDVTLGSGSYALDTTELEFSGDQVEGAQLKANLAYLPRVERIRFEDPAIPAGELYGLQEAYPEVDIDWVKDVFGTPVGTDAVELDISGTAPGSLEEVEALAAYFPSLEKLIMCGAPFENEDMAAFRDRMRPDYKVVWMVEIGKMHVRTDETSFMPGKGNLPVRNGECYNMRYLEDLIVVDVGHQGIQDVDWVVGTPHLKYLIMADGGPKNIEPLGCLKELVYLELFGTPLQDATPLIGCTALEDLNVCRTPVEIDGLLKMPWLKNLWISECGITAAEREALNEALPNTHIVYNAPHPVAVGWRKLPNYYKMRDALDMWYMD